MTEKKIGFTPEQLSAINSVTGDILVSAAAGSGKTAALVERIIRMILDNKSEVSIDNILAVTFTEAAASNMRQKIMLAIENQLETSSSKDKIYLQNQYHLVHQADIMTIDAFFLNVVRKNFRLIDIDPNFRIGDKTELLIIEKNILNEIFEEFYIENDSDFINFINAFSTNANDKNAFDIVLDIYKKIQSNLYPLQWLKSNCDMLVFNSMEEFLNSELINHIKNDCSDKIKEALLYLYRIKDFYNHHLIEVSPAILDDILQAEDLLAALDSNFMLFYEKIKSVTFKTFSVKTQLKKHNLEMYTDKIKNYRDISKSILQKNIRDYYFSNTLEYHYEQSAAVSSVLRAAYNVISELDKRLMKYKKEKSIFSFSDISHFCLDILCKNGESTETAKALSEKYTQIIIDEYQDINLIQDCILSAVSGKYYGKNNRFMVGDIKQSIYKFRLANPDIFIEKLQNYRNSDNPFEKEIDFTQNFRSRPNVLNCINYLFKSLMTESLGDINYTEKSSQLYPGADYPDYSDYPDKENLSKEEMNKISSCEFYVIDNGRSDTDASDETEEEIMELKNTELEAEFISKRIKELISEKFKVYDLETKQWRNIEYSDIVILLRYSKSTADKYCSILSQNGIPAFTKVDTGFFNLSEIMTILDLLSIIDNPLQEIPLISVLHSPIFSFSPDELLTIKLYNKNDYLYNNILSISKENDNMALTEKTEKFLSALSHWKELSLSLSISELLNLIYNESNYYNYLGILYNGKVKQANLDKMILKALDYEKTNLNGLFNFINYINQIKDNDNNSDGDALLLSENSNVVQILTIHKSKGLEYPVVFLSSLEKKFITKDMTSDILLHNKLGIGINYFKPVLDSETEIKAIPKYKETALSSSVIKDKLKSELYSEELRVLYVALTRAKEKLILVGAGAAPGSTLEKSKIKWTYSISDNGVISLYDRLYNSNNFISWIAMALSKHISGYPLRIDDLTSDDDLAEDSSDWYVKVISREECVSLLPDSENKAENITIEEKFDNFVSKSSENDYSTFKNKIFYNLSWEYPFSSDSVLPSKESISEIKRNHLAVLNENDDAYGSADESILSGFSEQSLLKKPKFMDTEKSLSKGTSYGTAYHEAFNFINFSSVNTLADVKKELERIVSEERLSPDTAKIINPNKILSFINSPLGRRIKKTDKIYKETPFVMSMTPYQIYKDEKYKNSDKKILINGIIDLYFEENGNLILVDYKTDHLAKENPQLVLDRYSIQLDIYKQALERSTGRTVSEYGLYLLAIDQYVKYS